MPAHVVVGVKCPAPVPDDQDTLSSHIDHQAVTDMTEPFGPAGVKPDPVKNPLPFQTEDGRRAVILSP